MVQVPSYCCYYVYTGSRKKLYKHIHFEIEWSWKMSSPNFLWLCRKCFQRIHIFLVISLNSEHGKRSLLNPYVKYFGILNSTNYFSLFCNVFVLTFICIICHVIFANVIQIVSFLINAILTYLLKIRREKDSCNSKWLSQVEQLNQTAHVLWEMIFIYLH